MESDKSLQYVAGMWKNDLAQALLWYPDPSVEDLEDCPTALSSIPSWSWASANRPVRMPRGYGILPNPRPIIAVLGVEVQYAGTTLASQVLNGTLRVRGEPARLSEQKAVHLVKGEVSWARFDRGILPADLAGEEVHTQKEFDVTLLAISAYLVESGPYDMYVLLLQPTGKHENEYRRVGIGLLSDADGGVDYYKSTRSAEVELTIV